MFMNIVKFTFVHKRVYEVKNDEVHVELVTGMQVKTKADSLYIQ